MVPVLTINKAYSMLRERKSQRNMSNTFSTTESGDVTALMMAKGGLCQRPKKNLNPQCDYCKLKDHTHEGYYKLIGYPADFKCKKKPNFTAAHNASVGEYRKQDAREGTSNYCDNHATDHIKGPYFTPQQYSQNLKLPKQGNTGEVSTNMAGIVNVFLVNSHKKERFVDSEATNHTVSDLNVLANKTELGAHEQKRYTYPMEELLL